jgi:hypothetical protein
VDTIRTALSEFADQRRFVCWRYHAREGNGRWKWTKPPIDPHTGRLAKCDDPTTWGTLDAAVGACTAHPGEYDGIGVMLGDGLAGIDMDRVRVDSTGALEPWADEMVRRLNSYAEVSPSGCGVKVFVRGHLPGGGRTRYGDSQLEVYAAGRYFTLTGRRLDDSPAVIADRPDRLAEVYAAVKGEGGDTGAMPPLGGVSTEGERGDAPAADDARLNGHHCDPGGRPYGPPADDGELIDLARNAPGIGPRFRELYDRGAEAGDDHSALDFELAKFLAFYTGKDALRMERLMGGSALGQREKWVSRPDYRRRTIERAIAEQREVYTGKRPAGAGVDLRAFFPPDPPAPPAPPAPPPTPPRPHTDTPFINIADPLCAVVDAAVSALVRDPDIYQRGGSLVRVVDKRVDICGIINRDDAPVLPHIIDVGDAHLADRLSSHAEWVRLDHKGRLRSCYPPAMVVRATAERRAWPGVRPLLAVVSSPTLRPDGTVLQTPGYDPATGLLYRPNAEYPHIPDHPTRDDARAAVLALAEVVVDVPFASAAHRAAWLAGVLTLVGRFGFAGPAPAFVVDAPAPGSGKSLIADCAAIIATGKPAPRTAYDPDDAETRRLITSLAVSGAPLVLLDNIDVSFGNAALANALTGTEWRDRILGRSAVTSVPLYAVWFATGNNVTYARDLGRRVCHIRIEAATAHPEERSGFRHPDLSAWVTSERPRLHAAALTILRAYAAAGRPPQRLTPWGSFEAWSSAVRSALVWAGLADPGQTRKEIRQSADSDVQALSTLLSALVGVYGLKVRFTAGDVVRRLTITPRGTDAAVDRLASALAEFCRLKDATPPGPHQLGMRLQRIRRRIVRIGDADYRLNSDDKGEQGVPWYIERP